MSLEKNSDGIDFFDFMYEAWLEKKYVLAIVVVFTLSSLATTFAMNALQGGMILPARKQIVRFALPFEGQTALEPYGRGIQALWSDLDQRLRKNGSNSFVNLRYLALGVERPDFTYEYQITDNSGFVYVYAPAGTEATVQSFAKSLLQVTKDQFADTILQTQSDVTLIDKLQKTETKTNDDRLMERRYSYERFLGALSAGKAGEVFLEIGPLQNQEIVSPIYGTSRSGLLRAAVIGSMIGVIVAGLFVMIRVGYRRKMAAASL